MKSSSPQHAYDAILNDPTHTGLLDVRAEHEYSMGHAPGSFNIPLDALPGHLHELEPYKHLYVICRSGARSMFAVRLLHDLGFSGELYNVEGGMIGWDSHGLPVE